MKGYLGSPHYLQVLILSFSCFFLLGSFVQFVINATNNCTYYNNDYTDSKTTNNEYYIECIGDSITAICYGLVSLLTMAGLFVGLYKSSDADLIIAFVIFGILVSYASDALTNLIVSCSAGDTTDQNLFDDDSYDAARKKCEIYSYSVAGGVFGMFGGFLGGYYGIKMKLNGFFYIQRPIGLFIAMSGYAMIFCFNTLATAFPTCHYYDEGKDQLPNTTPPYLPIEDDLVYDQLQPICLGYNRTAIGYGVGSFVSLMGIPVMFRYQKRGMWIIFATFLVFCSSSNYSTFEAVKLQSCNNKSNFLSGLPFFYNSYQSQQFNNSCKYFEISSYVSIIATVAAGLAVVISIVDTFILHIDHDTLIIRFRRAMFFAFGTCFSLANGFTLMASLKPDCNLYSGNLNDDAVSADTDDVIERTNCRGKTAQFLFYMISAAACALGLVISLIVNFPENKVAIGLMGLDEEDSNNDMKTADHDAVIGKQNEPLLTGYSVNDQNHDTF